MYYKKMSREKYPNLKYILVLFGERILDLVFFIFYFQQTFTWEKELLLVFK